MDIEYKDLMRSYGESRSCPLPPIMPATHLISTQCLAEKDGIEYWSRVYDSGDEVIKQASLDLAEREALFLSDLTSSSFPKVIDVRSERGYSVVVLEKIQGVPLGQAKADINTNEVR